MSLKKTRGILRVLMVLFVLFLLLCEGTGSGWFLALAAAVGVVMLTLQLLFWTCPECGRHLGRMWGGKHCPGCGAKLDL